MNTDTTRGRINPSQCDHCHLPGRSDGADQCLGWLPGVMNACCGHGDLRTAYVQFSPWFRISGWVADTYLWALTHFRDRFVPNCGPKKPKREEGEPNNG